MFRRTIVPALILAGALIACERSGESMEKPEIPIACRPQSLTAAERAREELLLEEHLGAVLETRDTPNGQSYRYSTDPALFVRMAELVSLEHRCCPFLDFALEWRGPDEAPWLHITGSARAKEFIAETFAPR